MTARQMTEAQAWRLVAERFADERVAPRWGLCHEVAELPGELVSALIRRKMETRVYRHMRLLESYGPLAVEGRRGENGFLTETGTRQGRSVRVLAALLLALECEEEGA